ncbi:MAG: hypothetical protein WBO70_03450, partial [Erysipelotrichaceae bacterium]
MKNFQIKNQIFKLHQLELIYNYLRKGYSINQIAFLLKDYDYCFRRFYQEFHNNSDYLLILKKYFGPSFTSINQLLGLNNALGVIVEVGKTKKEIKQSLSNNILLGVVQWLMSVVVLAFCLFWLLPNMQAFMTGSSDKSSLIDILLWLIFIGQIVVVLALLLMFIIYKNGNGVLFNQLFQPKSYLMRYQRYQLLLVFNIFIKYST